MKKQKINPRKGVKLWAVYAYKDGGKTDYDRVHKGDWALNAGPNFPFDVAPQFFYTAAAARKRYNALTAAVRHCKKKGIYSFFNCCNVRMEAFVLRHQEPFCCVGENACARALLVEYRDGSRFEMYRNQKRAIDYFFYCVQQGSLRMFAMKEDCMLRITQDNSARDLFAKDQKEAKQ